MNSLTGRLWSSTSETRSSSGSRPVSPWLPSAEVEFAQLRQRHLADQAVAVGGAIHPPVVHTHQMPVAGEPNIAFDTVGALFEGQFIGGQRVLRTFGRCATVC